MYDFNSPDSHTAHDKLVWDLNALFDHPENIQIFSTWNCHK
jgi:hypothetical protein